MRVVGDDGGSQAAGVRSDQGIERTDAFAARFEVGADLPRMQRGGLAEIGDLSLIAGSEALAIMVWSSDMVTAEIMT